MPTSNKIEMIAQNIVHQLMDLVAEEFADNQGLFVDFRQESNDKMIDFVEALIKEGQTEAFRYGKIKGSKSFAKIVRTMRDYQNRYFQTKSKEALVNSKKSEQRVDEALKLILK